MYANYFNCLALESASKYTLYCSIAPTFFAELYGSLEKNLQFSLGQNRHHPARPVDHFVQFGQLSLGKIRLVILRYFHGTSGGGIPTTPTLVMLNRLIFRGFRFFLLRGLLLRGLLLLLLWVGDRGRCCAGALLVLLVVGRGFTPCWAPAHGDGHDLSHRTSVGLWML